MASLIHGPVTTTLQAAGYNAERLEHLGRYMENLVDTGRVQAAAFLCARKGEIFAYQAIGSLTFAPDSPQFQPDSIKSIASITKLFTATAIMQLVENGTLWLGQPVKEIIAEFDTPTHAGISIWNLLTHTSGLPADPGYFLEPYPIPWFSRTLRQEQWLREILAGPLQSPTGTQWNYCTLGYIVLGEIIARASGISYKQYIEENICRPIGLYRTFVEVPQSLHDEVSFADEHDREHLKESGIRPAGFPPPSGGGIYSTLHDLFCFGQCFLNGGAVDGGRILGRKSVETMMRNHLENIPSFHWGTNCRTYRHGLGWGFYADGTIASPSCVNHDGSGWSTLFVDPEEEFIYAHFFADNNEWDPKVMVNPRVIAFSGLL